MNLSDPEPLSSEEKYPIEKDLGLRRDNGARKLKELRPWHIQMAKMHMEGFSNNEIAIALRKQPVTVCVALGDPKVQALFAFGREGNAHEFKALEVKAIDAVRKGLREGGDLGLKAATVWFKERDRQEIITGSGEDGAEDVISKIFAKIENSTVNIQVNTGPLIERTVQTRSSISHEHSESDQVKPLLATKDIENA